MEFAALFDPGLIGNQLTAAIDGWQQANLRPATLARVALVRSGAAGQGGRILVTFPGGESRFMDPGPSSVISKAVVEDFAQRFLEEPAVVWLSESRRHVVARDDALAQQIGLVIEPDKNLPDVILVDLGRRETLLVFVEVVATPGVIGDARQEALMDIASEAAFAAEQVAFVTAYADRDESVFKSSVSDLAWGSFAWFMSEPENILVLHHGAESPGVVLSDLMRQ